ncbi:glycoprotein L [Human betaherpesvirus 6A]|uniref:Envelope glycoprotein L n=1 Tax=Human betaherpesvirus 6A TaxID=32603 RepID=A0A0A7RM63_9BETA|nr:glycoprotein L [Human betaherpesvirus 6A]AVI09281.1 gL [Human betaherpesvirus 6A]
MELLLFVMSLILLTFSKAIPLFNHNSFYFEKLDDCIAAVINCTKSEVPLLLEPIYQPPVYNEDVMSILLQPPTKKKPFSRIMVTDEFLSDFLLLQDNPEQLRTLFALIRDPESRDNWLNFFNGFQTCSPSVGITTCIRDNCRKYSPEKITYVNNFFVDNIAGLEFNISENTDSFYSNIGFLLYLENPARGVTKIIRFPFNSLTLFDTILNCLKYFHLKTGVELDLLKHMETYNSKLPFRSSRPTILIRNT